jgi:hypothetical protein
MSAPPPKSHFTRVISAPSRIHDKNLFYVVISSYVNEHREGSEVVEEIKPLTGVDRSVIY